MEAEQSKKYFGIGVVHESKAIINSFICFFKDKNSKLKKGITTISPMIFTLFKIRKEKSIKELFTIKIDEEIACIKNINDKYSHKTSLIVILTKTGSLSFVSLEESNAKKLKKVTLNFSFKKGKSYQFDLNCKSELICVSDNQYELIIIKN